MADVCIITKTNAILNADTRVFKEAFSLRDAGYRVHIVGAKWFAIPAREEIDGVQVDRVSPRIEGLKKLPGALVWPILAIPLLLMLPFVLFTKKKHKTTMRLAFDRAVPGIINWALLPVFWRRVYRLTRGQRYQVYHAHDLVALPIAWWMKKRRGGAVVYDCHELWLDRNTWRKRTRYNPDRVFEWFLESFLIRRANAVLVVSESIADTLAKRYRIRRPVVVLNTPYYIDLAKENGLPDLRSRAGITDNKPIVLYIGLISYGRGLERLVEAMSHVPDCRLVLMGYDVEVQYTETIRKLAQEYGVIDRLHFVDAVPFPEVPLWVASADVATVLPDNRCLSYYYCMPNKLFEAIMAGVPVIASDFPDMKKVISEKRIGWTVNPESVTDTAKAINALLQDREAQGAMRRNALEAAKIYNWEEQSKKLLDVYREIVPSSCKEETT